MTGRDGNGHRPWVALKRERLQVEVDLYEQKLKPRYIDGVEIPRWEDGPEVAEYIHQAWTEGWVLVDARNQVIIFEREDA